MCKEGEEIEPKGRKQSNISKYNNKLVARLLLDKPHSCMEMAKKVNLTHVATGVIADRLFGMDLIRVCVENITKRTKGRQHIRYELNPNRAFFVCVNFQHGLESLLVCDICGNIVYSQKLDGRTIDEQYTAEIIELIGDCIKKAELPLERLAVISIAVPGRVDGETGEVIVSSKIKENVNLKESFENSFPGVVVDIKNDIVYACTGSMLSEEFDYEKGTHLFAYFGTGMSCCLINNKQIVLNSNGFGGEIGMNTVDRNGERLNDVVNSTGLLNMGREVLNAPDLTFEQLMEQSEGNTQIKAKMLDIANVLGYVLRNIVDIAGCSHIVFAGTITQYPQFFFDEFVKVLKSSLYGEKLSIRIDMAKDKSANKGQIYQSRLTALDWVMSQS